MTEAASHADFSSIRYAQCWEDADVLVKALAPEPGHLCLSIASAGDNAFALLSKPDVHVVAVDLNPAQLACLELRMAAYQELAHGEFLELMGSRSSSRRTELYARCRRLLSSNAAAFWDRHAGQISAGIGSAGKFERYFALFRTRILPLIHSLKRVDQLLAGGELSRREEFYSNHWDTWRWRLLF